MSPRTPSGGHDLHDLVIEAEAQLHATAVAHELRCNEELERRRRELATECERLLESTRTPKA